MDSTKHSINNLHCCFKIGEINLPSAVMLAPMAGYSDTIFRGLIRGFGGLGLAFSEMVNPRSALYGGGVKRDAILATSPDDKPLSWQIYGGPREPVADAARWLVGHGAKMLDINMGCPKRKITARGAGAGMLKHPESALLTVRNVVKAVSVPVSVKIRLGWQENIIAKSDLIRKLEETGVSSITVHPRTAVQGYTGRADWQQIRYAVEQAKNIPIIGNGDITTPELAVRMIKETGCSGVMIGRAALKTPWIIRDAFRLTSGLPPEPAPTTTDVLTLMKTHFKKTVDFSGPERAPLVFKKWIPLYSKTLQLSKSIMIELLKISETDRLKDMMCNLT